ncbi:MAG: DNA polymerase III subunit beta [Chloroflexi bacterium]|nr:DNA polymerase III subunit beta [Chloroflexota bacterium]
MEIAVDQSNLSRALRLACRALSTRAPLPILQNVLLVAEAGTLTLTAADGEIVLVTTVPADVTHPGRTAAPARLLAEYVSQLPSEPLRLLLDGPGKRLRATCGRFDAGLSTADPDDFPVLPPADQSTALDLDAHHLRRAIERVAFAAARDDSRPILAAVLFELGEQGLTVAAADGFRLARAVVAGVAGDDRHLLVPVRAVAEFGRLLVDADTARLIVTPDGGGVHLVAGGTRLFSRLIDGRFPDIDRVIPREARTRVVVQTAGFRQAVRVAGLFGKDGQVRPVVFEARPGGLRLMARGDETGEAEGEVAAIVAGEAQSVALNSRLLVDLLDTVDGSQLELSWTSPQSPVVVREVGHEDSPDLWLAMPLHLPQLARPLAEAA